MAIYHVALSAMSINQVGPGGYKVIITKDSNNVIYKEMERSFDRGTSIYISQQAFIDVMKELQNETDVDELLFYYGQIYLSHLIHKRFSTLIDRNWCKINGEEVKNKEQLKEMCHLLEKFSLVRVISNKKGEYMKEMKDKCKENVRETVRIPFNAIRNSTK